MRVERGERMSVVDLMLLGFLKDKPMNAYEIKKTAEQRNLTWWIKVSYPSMYRNINKLAEQGYIDGKVVKEGEMPEKTIYTINEKGEAYFLELMEKYSKHPASIYIDFTAVISNLNKVDNKTGRQMLDDLYQEFFKTKEIMRAIEDTYDKYQAKAVIQLNVQMYDLFCTWLLEFKEKFYGSSTDALEVTDK